jgi:hypothetical protein
MKSQGPTFTSLGMHFVSVSAKDVVTVLVEVNVRGLLSLHARRLCKSKRGMACLSSGTVRMTLATPTDHEAAHAVWLREAGDEKAIHSLLQMNERLEREVSILKSQLKGSVR